MTSVGPSLTTESNSERSIYSPSGRGTSVHDSPSSTSVHDSSPLSVSKSTDEVRSKHSTEVHTAAPNSLDGPNSAPEQLTEQKSTTNHKTLLYGEKTEPTGERLSGQKSHLEASGYDNASYNCIRDNSNLSGDEQEGRTGQCNSDLTNQTMINSDQPDQSNCSTEQPDQSMSSSDTQSSGANRYNVSSMMSNNSSYQIARYNKMSKFEQHAADLTSDLTSTTSTVSSSDDEAISGISTIRRNSVSGSSSRDTGKRILYSILLLLALEE